MKTSCKIRKIVDQMTIEEKVAQMLQLSANANTEEVFSAFKNKGTLGSYLHVLGSDSDEFRKAANDSRLKIPPIFGIDAIHGHALLKGATVFPSQLALACTFDEALVEEVGHITAVEVAADGLDWVFSPVLCLGRDLRWGRVNETFGEDAEVASRLGAAMIKGYQKDGLVAACAKHYIAYGEATGGRDSYDSEVTERKLREIFLKPFKAAVDAGCMTFMTGYGSVDGTPLTTDYHLLTEVLKNELGFDGFIVTDWCNFESLINGQKVAENMDEAVVSGINAGNDMSMNSYEFYESTLKMVKQGKIPINRINDAVTRILMVKERLGLLSDNRKERPSKDLIGCSEHQQVNYETALKSAVLLQNDGVLPLNPFKKIAVIGPNANDVWAQYGDWTYFTHPNYDPNAVGRDEVYTIYKGIKEVYSESSVSYQKGCSIKQDESQEISDKWFEDALEEAKQADVIIAVLGDNMSKNGEAKDRSLQEPFGRQLELLKAIRSLGKKIVTILVNGKPFVITEIAKYSDAVIETFNGGDMCGLAVAKLIKGEENFSGKLPISFPYNSSSGPVYYNQYDYWHGNKYIDVPAGSPYPFGFGLSYSDFELAGFTVSKKQVTKDEEILVSISVSNKSHIDGIDTIQLYYKDKVCKILTPIRTLIDFKKVTVKKGETMVVNFTIPVNKLGYYNSNLEYKVDPGKFVFYATDDGVHFNEIEFEVI